MRRWFPQLLTHRETSPMAEPPSISGLTASQVEILRDFFPDRLVEALRHQPLTAKIDTVRDLLENSWEIVRVIYAENPQHPYVRECWQVLHRMITMAQTAVVESGNLDLSLLLQSLLPDIYASQEYQSLVALLGDQRRLPLSARRQTR